MKLRWTLILAPPLLWAAAVIVLWPGPWDTLTYPWFLASAAFYVAASVLLVRAPRNSIGWMLMGFPLPTAFAVVGRAIVDQAGAPTRLVAWADTIGNGFATVTIMFLSLMLLHFPDGLLPSPRWITGPHRSLATI